MQQRLSTFITFSLMLLFSLIIIYTPEVFAAGGLTDAGKQISDIMDAITRILGVISVSVFTVVILFAGYKMAFQHARWSDISHIVLGGLLIASASGIANLILGKG